MALPFPSHITPLESPTFATINLLPSNIAINAVVPKETQSQEYYSSLKFFSIQTNQRKIIIIYQQHPYFSLQLQLKDCLFQELDQSITSHNLFYFHLNNF